MRTVIMLGYLLSMWVWLVWMTLFAAGVTVAPEKLPVFGIVGGAATLVNFMAVLYLFDMVDQGKSWKKKS